MILVGAVAVKSIKSVIGQIDILLFMSKVLKTKSKRKLLTILLILITAFSGGGMVPLVKIGLKQLPSFSYSFLRFAIALICILPFLKKEKISIYKDLKLIFSTVIFATINILLFIFAIPYTSANLGQLVYVAVPIIVSIISYFTIAEKITIKKFIGIIFGVLGCAILILLNPVHGYSFVSNAFGGLFIIAAAISFSFYITLSKKIQNKVTPLKISFYFILVTTIFSFLFSFKELDAIVRVLSEINFMTLISLFIVGSIGTTFYYLLQQYVIYIGTATNSAAINLIQPIFTYFWANLLLGEEVGLYFYISAFLILSGSYFIISET